MSKMKDHLLEMEETLRPEDLGRYLDETPSARDDDWDLWRPNKAIIRLARDEDGAPTISLAQTHAESAELDTSESVSLALPRVRLPKVSVTIIVKPMGTSWNGLVEAVFRKSTYEATFQPLLWDLRNEEQELLAAGRTGKARWLRICTHYYYLSEIRKLIIPIEKLFSWMGGIAK